MPTSRPSFAPLTNGAVSYSEHQARATAFQDAANAAIQNAGTYDPVTPYSVNDLVKHNGVRYLCLAPSTGVEPGTDVTKWETW